MDKFVYGWRLSNGLMIDYWDISIVGCICFLRRFGQNQVITTLLTCMYVTLALVILNCICNLLAIIADK